METTIKEQQALLRNISNNVRVMLQDLDCVITAFKGIEVAGVKDPFFEFVNYENQLNDILHIAEEDMQELTDTGKLEVYQESFWETIVDFLKQIGNQVLEYIKRFRLFIKQQLRRKRQSLVNFTKIGEKYFSNRIENPPNPTMYKVPSYDTLATRFDAYEQLMDDLKNIDYTNDQGYGVIYTDRLAAKYDRNTTEFYIDKSAIKIIFNQIKLEKSAPLDTLGWDDLNTFTTLQKRADTILSDIEYMDFQFGKIQDAVERELMRAAKERFPDPDKVDLKRKEFSRISTIVKLSTDLVLNVSRDAVYFDLVAAALSNATK